MRVMVMREGFARDKDVDDAEIQHLGLSCGDRTKINLFKTFTTNVNESALG